MQLRYTLRSETAPPGTLAQQILRVRPPLPEPRLLPLQGLDHAVELTRQSRAAIVLGDGDADGTCGAAIVTLALEAAGISVRTVIPNRLTDGFGPRLHHFRSPDSQSPDLAVIVDTGSLADQVIRQLRARGMRVIVLDHHAAAGGRLASPDALINPRLQPQASPLSGAGLALRYAGALLSKCPPGLLPIAAIGTVADMVPMTGENQMIVRAGLAHTHDHAGISEIAAAMGVGRPMTSADLGFSLGPAINGACRLGRPILALECLLGVRSVRPNAVQELVEANRRRQEIVAAESDHAARHAVSADPLMIAVGPYHVGVIGLIAQALMRDTGRPAIVLSTVGATTGIRGSARAPAGVSILDILRPASQHLTEWGGHAEAAGLTVRPGHLQAFLAAVAKHAPEGGAPTPPEIVADFPRRPETLRPGEVIEAERRAGPFGQEHPAPHLTVRERILRRRVFGRTGAHCEVTAESGNTYVWFHGAAKPLPQEATIIYTPEEKGEIRCLVQHMLPLVS